MRNYRATIFLATIYALFHIFCVVVPLISTGGSGEGQAVIVIYLDYPLLLLLSVIPDGEYIVNNLNIAYILFFSIGGTLMYGFVGSLLGFVIDKLRGKDNATPNKTFEGDA